VNAQVMQGVPGGFFAVLTPTGAAAVAVRVTLVPDGATARDAVYGVVLAREGAGARAAEADRDGDGVSDAVDNCVAAANADQSDADGDGIGNACECGDVTGDGRVTTVDARVIQRCVVGGIPCAALCDVSGDGRCTTVDARLIQRLAVGQIAKVDLICAARPAGGGP